MATLRIYNDIVDEESKVWLQGDGLDGVCYKDIQDFLDTMADDDVQIDLRLHCKGGDCVEGWAIYDALRRSNKMISATVEGECSSMATIILLAAPKERRNAYKNAHFCIHNPSAEYIGGDLYERLTSENLETMSAQIAQQAKMLRDEQEKIISLYIERTGASRKELQKLMDEDTYIDTDKAQELGFISTILVPTTAKSNKRFTNKLRTTNMKAKKTVKTILVKQTVMNRLLAKAGLKSIKDLRMTAQVVTAADGSELTVEREEGDPQVGDVAYPSGEYVFDDGTKVVVENEVITAIIAPAADNPDDEPEVEALAPEDAEIIQAQIDGLQAKIDELQAQLDASQAQNEELEQTLNENTVDAEDRAILDRVHKAGGMAWLNRVMNMKSTFNPTNRRFVEHGATDVPNGETKTQKAIRERREAAAAKRKARN